MNENEENVIVKTKTNKGIIILLVILILMVIGLSGYVVYDKVISKDETNENVENKNEEEKIEEEELPEKSSEHTYLDMNKKNIMLNNKNHNFLVYLYYDDAKVFGEEGYVDGIIIYAEAYLNNKRVLDMIPIDNFAGINDDELLDKRIYDDFNYLILTNKIKDISNDEEYFVFSIEDISKEPDSAFAEYMRKTLIIDSNSNIIESINQKMYKTLGLSFLVSKEEAKDRGATTMDGENYYVGEYPNIVNNNTLYYIDTNIEDLCGEGPFDEYKITIQNGKVNKIKTNTYIGDQIQGAGGC